jgi:hypothetical protein
MHIGRAVCSFSFFFFVSEKKKAKDCAATDRYENRRPRIWRQRQAMGAGNSTPIRIDWPIRPPITPIKPFLMEEVPKCIPLE